MRRRSEEEIIEVLIKENDQLQLSARELSHTLTVQKELCEAACAFVMGEKELTVAKSSSPSNWDRLRGAVDAYQRMIGER